MPTVTGQEESVSSEEVAKVVLRILSYAGGKDALAKGNYSEAESYFLKAAELEYAPAYLELAELFRKGGKGRDKPGLSIDYIRKAAAQGYPKGLNEYALCLSRGDDVEQDYSEAAVYFTLAEEKGCLESKAWLAWLYLEGNGLPESPEMAFKLFQEGAHAGCRFAQYGLAHCYRNELATPRSDQLAREWYRRSAEQEYSYGQYWLALYLAEGVGGGKDPQQAREFLILCAAQNAEIISEKAREALQILNRPQSTKCSRCYGSGLHGSGSSEGSFTECPVCHGRGFLPTR